jgi:hypothetical protein
MTKNPLINALVALVYISLVASVTFYAPKHTGPVNSPVAPIAAISLFTLSAAVMAYLFGYQPAQLYFDGKKKQAVSLFLKTVGIFAAFTVIILTLFLSGITG